MDLAKIRKKHKKTDEPAGGKGADSLSISAVTQGAVSSKETGSEEESLPISVSEPAVIDSSPVDVSVHTDLSLIPDEQKSELRLEFITFKVGREDFAFSVDEVAEILKDQIITFVPRAPDFVVGVTSMNGKIIPVIDPSKRLCVPEAEPESEDRKKKKKILIIKGSKGQSGMLLYGTMDVISVQKELIQSPPAHLGERGRGFVEIVLNVGGKFISVLRTEDFLNF